MAEYPVEYNEVSGSFMIGDGAKVVKDTFKHRAVKGERSDMSNILYHSIATAFQLPITPTIQLA
jgi:hypothetical protein